MAPPLSTHTLLIANRGEIAARIQRTAHALGMRTIALYTPSDATAPHVSAAALAVALPLPPGAASEAAAYMDADAIVRIAKTHGATLLHPGYGLLAESPALAVRCAEHGVAFVGPRAEVIARMGAKPAARAAAVAAGVPVLPGSGLLDDADAAVEAGDRAGWPVVLKAAAGGGGMGMVVCADATELRARFGAARERAKVLFGDEGVFVERYVAAARHVEIQVFGDGAGHVVHMGERECSVQRRYQKLLEETPSPFLDAHPGLREDMCAAAVRLCESIAYTSAGTVEFLVDAATAQFFFLEMNTRIQVEHTVTEAARPGLDLVALMLRLAAREPFALPQAAVSAATRHALQARVYAEDAIRGFAPAPGVLTAVAFPARAWLRVDTWVRAGTAVTPHFDALLAKVVVHGADRTAVLARMDDALCAVRLCGPVTNVEFLRAVCRDGALQRGEATTGFLAGFVFAPHAIEVLDGGLATTVQDLPGRTVWRGVPRSGPLDALAHRAANVLAGNAPGVETLEITLHGPTLRFHAAAVVALAGAPADATLDGTAMPLWTRVPVHAGAVLRIGAVRDGMRSYLAVQGGFPDIPEYLGSKSTSMGFGGYQGRPLAVGDQLALAPGSPAATAPLALPPTLIPTYPTHWTLHVLSGPHAAPDFLTPAGLAAFFGARWTVGAASSRMGVRLAGPALGWARASGGAGGAHPSNVLDGAYALGAVNLNGDTPVLLAHEGPDMGGYACVCVLARAELWKLGQLRPGHTVRFVRVGWAQALQLQARADEWLDQVARPAALRADAPSPLLAAAFADTPQDPRLHVVAASGERPQAVFRQAGDAAVLLEYGEMTLDVRLRARVHAFEQALEAHPVAGVRATAPCIRSTMIHFDPRVVSQRALLHALVAVEHALPDTTRDLVFPGRRVTFPVVLDDRWSRGALERYARSVRDEAVYLPSNVEYLARNNGLEGAEAALRVLVGTDWLVFGVGFYLACPFLVPIDPRCRLVGQKMNPSRTYTPRGALGIAGPVAAIYPVESPGGYQLFGRTLPPWQTWGRGAGFAPAQPWLLRPFDQVAFKVVSEEEYLALEQQFDAGQYVFDIEPATFSMAAYHAFADSVADSVHAFEARKAAAAEREAAREAELLLRWQMRKADAAAGEAGRAAYALDDADAGGYAVKASLTATVWKIPCAPGDVVTSADEVLVVLEAMKTEVNVPAGAENVGRTVRGFGKNVHPGGLVQAGDVLVVLD